MLLRSRHFILSSVAFLLVLTAGCDGAKQGRPAFRVRTAEKAKSNHKVEAKEKTEESFKVEQKPSVPVTPRPSLPPPITEKSKVVFKANQAEISIAKIALDKEFLLQGVLIPQDGVAMGKSIKSRVIAFHIRGKSLIMLEATHGHSINSDFSQKLVLATFNILKQDDDFITFDFNAGMSKLMALRDWYAKDIEGQNYSTEKQFAASQVLNSYIEEAQIDNSNQLVIRQISLMNATQTSKELGSIRIPVEVKYYLSPYRPTESYRPYESPRRFDQMGFFEINPQLNKSGMTVTLASRFNPEKPIVFAISANTPPDFRKAVQDGILYWNKAFGKEIVQAIIAPEHVRAPDINYNVVQWVTHDNAGSAYADGQMDPRTGEILHAQVYLTSAFAFGGKNKARETLRKLTLTPDLSTPESLSPFLKGLNKEEWCNLEYRESLAKALENVINQNLEDDKVLKVSQDYVREVVAHEIGHTLGLRHNFAGTLAASYKAADRQKLFKDYLNNGKANTDYTYSSSVMDYHRLEESAILGNLIELDPKPLSYDLKAIRKLYFDEDLKLNPNPLFCTDSHADIEGFVDCQRFDFGSSPLEYAHWKIETSINELPQSLIEKYIRNKTDSLAKPYLIEQVPLEPTPKLADTLLQPLSDTMKLLTSDRALLKVERNFEEVDERTEDQLQDAYDSYIETEVSRLGGLNSLINVLPPHFSEKTKSRIEAALNSPSYREGFGYGGTPFSMTGQEISQIKRDLFIYVEKLEKSLIKSELKKIRTTEFNRDVNSKSSLIRNNPVSLELAQVLARKMEKYILSTSGTVIETDLTKDKYISKVKIPLFVLTAAEKVYETIPVKLPVFSYSTDIRELAATLLNEGRGEDVAWGSEEKFQIIGKLNRLLEESLTVPLETIEPSKQNKTVFRWIAENKKVKQSFK
ncbi:MAG: hypothetical protein RJB66_1110 [Pseudomonadota bacterium]|jgi:hypothetical protein